MADDPPTVSKEPASSDKNAQAAKPADKIESDERRTLDELKKKLGNIKFQKATDAELAALTGKAAKSVAPGPTRWVTEWGGRGLGHSFFDLSALLEIAAPLGSAVRWYARSLFHGGNEIGLPGAQAALAGSLVLVLGPGLTEKPRVAGDEEFFPTVEGGRLLTATMAAANNQDELTEIFASLTKNAAKAYASTLEVMVDRELSVSTYLDVDGKSRVTRLVLEQARDDLAWLTRAPETVSHEMSVVGVFRAVDDRREGKFALAVESDNDSRRTTQEVITGPISADLRHQPLTTRMRVRAQIRVIEPKEAWLPRAPATRYVLVGFERVGSRG
jgi:hypothetical protein